MVGVFFECWLLLELISPHLKHCNPFFWDNFFHGMLSVELSVATQCSSLEWNENFSLRGAGVQEQLASLFSMQHNLVLGLRIL